MFTVECKCERNTRVRKSSLCNPHGRFFSGQSHKCMLGGHFNEKQDICIILSVLLQIAHEFQGKVVTIQWSNTAP